MSDATPTCRGAGPGRPTRRALAWLALLAPFFYASYGLANHLAGMRGSVPSVVFDWERQVPFWSWTIFPYWSVNVFYGLSLLLARTRHELDRHGARLLTAQVVAVGCFIAWPLAFSFGQPAAEGAAGWLFAALRGFDKPFNQAPSLHIALTVILWDLYRRRLPPGWPQGLLHLWALAICGSVLTTWQHHFIDLPTGALLGVLCVWAWPLERRAAMWRIWRTARDPLRWRLALRYAVGALLVALVAQWLGGVALWLWWVSVALLLVALNYAGFGAGGFQMDRGGRMSWPSRWLLAPYRLGAWANAWIWTRRQPPARELLPGVWIGSLARMRNTHARRATCVSLCAELQAPTALRASCLPWLDLVPASPAALRRAAGQIESAVQRGDAVLVACALGFSRSAAALACWLTHSGRAADADDAVRRLQQLHPRVTLGEGWREALRRATQAGATP